MPVAGIGNLRQGNDVRTAPAEVACRQKELGKGIWVLKGAKWGQGRETKGDGATRKRGDYRDGEEKEPSGARRLFIGSEMTELPLIIEVPRSLIPAV
ncbi:hypothetical protein ACLOJK_011320 [Asimina triloba]